MKKVLFGAFTGFLILMMSCKSGGGDPKLVLSDFFNALSKNDIVKARTLATEDSKSLLDMMEMAMKTDKTETDKFNTANMQFGEAKIDGDKATVPVKETTSGETMNYTLKKEGGSWKVAFDKTSLMTMGMEKMKEEGLTDSVSNVLDELKNLDTDSLKATLNEGLKVIDSAQKKMKKQ
jgi:hypothetical protein